MKLNFINYKDILEKNAIKKLTSYLINFFAQKDKELEESLSLMKDNIKEAGNTEISLSKDINLKQIKEEREKLSKFQYHFPDLLNIGDIINKKEIISPLFKKEESSFYTQAPFYIPVASSGMAFLINSKYSDRINNIIENIGLKMINSLPDGLAKITIIDKSGAGQNFPIFSLLHEKFTEGSILSEDTEITRELEEIKKSMATIAQNISSNGFESPEDYNLNTDEVPQRYQFIFINGFPNGFSKKATENLMSLIESGHKSGIYIFMSVNFDPIFGLNQNINGISLNQILKRMVTFEISNRPVDLVREGKIKENIELVKFPLKNEENIKTILNSKCKLDIPDIPMQVKKENVEYLNNRIKDLNLRPVVGINKIYPDKKDFWTREAGKGVFVPFGKKGIENVFLSLGINPYGEDESTHHGMIGGSTGSGKTVLIHDIILMLATYYSPKDLRFYFLDYKEGTESAIYKDFPYMEILSMEAEIEFGHEVLQKAIDLMVERGKLFKKEGVANLHNYNKKVGEDRKLPRIIIIIDEFQVLFPNDQRITSKSNELIDRILRLGRSFGINLLLSTQTLKGVNLEPSILSNMPLRKALRMDEKDSAKIFSDENTAPQYLNNPGEGIYNKSYGNSKYNSHFQAFFASNEDIEKITKGLIDHFNETYSEEERAKITEDRFIYNGEIEPIYKKPKNYSLKSIFIGEPAGLDRNNVSIDLSINDYGENILIVGKDQIKAASIVSSIIDQLKESEVKLFNFNRGLEKKFLNKFANIKMFSNKDYENELDNLYKELERRKEEEQSDYKKIFTFFFYIESSKLFGENFNSPNRKKLDSILSMGPEYGIHSIIYATDFSSLTNADLSRDLGKFKKKIALKGGNSLKILGSDSTIKFSDSKHISIIDKGVLNEDPIKFKPYIHIEFKKGNNNE